MYARVTWVDGKKKRHARWRAAADREHARQLCGEMLKDLPPQQPPAGIVENPEDFRRGKGMYVYFVQMLDGHTNPIKIGIAHHPASRIRGLYTGSPFPLKTLLTYQPRNGAITELKLHRKFAKHRLRGEWFRPHSDILGHIAGLKIDLRKRPKLSELVEYRAKDNPNDLGGIGAETWNASAP